MLIVCPSCATTYQVEAASLGASGRSVRCARCRNVWFAAPTADAPAPMSMATNAAATAGAAAFQAAEDDWGTAGSAAGGPGDPAEAAGDAGTAASAAADIWATEEASADGAAAMADVEAPSLVPSAPDLAAAGETFDHESAGPPAEDIESFAARRVRQQRRRRLEARTHGLAALIAVMLAIEAALIAWRVEVVTVLPQTASLFAAMGLPVNVRGLAFENVGTATEVQDGVSILVIEGSVVNPGRKPLEVPRLRFSIRDQAGRELYAWTALPGRPTLAAGETLPFRSRLASPPPETRDAVVRFFNRRDAPVTGR